MIQVTGELTPEATDNSGGVYVNANTGVFSVSWIAVDSSFTLPDSFEHVIANFEQAGLLVEPEATGEHPWRDMSLSYQEFVVTDPAEEVPVRGLVAMTHYPDCGRYLQFMVFDDMAVQGEVVGLMQPYLDTFECR